MSEKVVVLLSGGLDSSTATATMVKSRGAENVIGLSILYGQKHSKELEAARRVAEYLGIKHIVREIPNIFEGYGSTLIDADKPNPEMTYEEIQNSYGVSPTYVPFRNGILLSLATALALVEGAELVVIGAHSEDAHNFAYPDCTPDFNDRMGAAIYHGTYYKCNLYVPFQYKSKADIVRHGMEMDFPYQLTWSCYNGREVACGTCPTCVGRLEAFKQAGYTDPVPYEFQAQPQEEV